LKGLYAVTNGQVVNSEVKVLHEVFGNSYSVMLTVSMNESRLYKLTLSLDMMDAIVCKKCVD